VEASEDIDGIQAIQKHLQAPVPILCQTTSQKGTFTNVIQRFKYWQALQVIKKYRV